MRMNFETEWLDDARRYYTNIVGKYGTQVQALLKKAAGIEIRDHLPAARPGLAQEHRLVHRQVPASGAPIRRRTRP